MLETVRYQISIALALGIPTVLKSNSSINWKGAGRYIFLDIDWFHITMRITVLKQFARGLIRSDPLSGVRIYLELDRLKWYLWHGNVYEAVHAISSVEMLIYTFEDTYPKFKMLQEKVLEFQTYLGNNASFVTNYAERYRYGETISTSFVESTINQVLAKRFNKRQQMQWSKRGAHLLLQTRTRMLNDDLEEEFRAEYPAFRPPMNDSLSTPVAA